jgi:hypothetical protein
MQLRILLLEELFRLQSRLLYSILGAQMVSFIYLMRVTLCSHSCSGKNASKIFIINFKVISNIFLVEVSFALTHTHEYALLVLLPRMKNDYDFGHFRCVGMYTYFICTCKDISHNGNMFMQMMYVQNIMLLKIHVRNYNAFLIAQQM